MAINYELTSGQLQSYLQGTANVDASASKLLSNNLCGIEGVPYQFMESVDRRIPGTDVGRKYADKIAARMPLLFLTPCKQVFMDDFSDSDKQTMISALLNSNLNISNDLLTGSGKYYSVEFDYATYYGYLNVMLTSVATYLGISNEEITINNKKQKIGTVDWSEEMKAAGDTFKTFVSSEENIVFYLDGLSSVSESFSNSTTSSSLADSINGYADSANEIKFLFGQKGNLIANAADATSDVVSSIASSLSGVMSSLGGGLVSSLSDKGVNTVLNGGKIIFPEIWSNSEFDRSYSLDIKLRSPDHDTISIFMNVLKPYCKILCLTLPKVMDDDVNGYKSPFLVKGFSKGLFNVDMGIISGLNVTKGAECCWNDDGLPTQIDISIELKDLYSSLAMSGKESGEWTITSMAAAVNNTSYMDYLANMAGLNIAQMYYGRKAQMLIYLTGNQLSNIPSRAFNRLDQGISNLMGRLYNLSS
jgi:hypothetical protein